MKRLTTLAALLLLTVSSSSMAYTFSLDRFSIIRNDTLIYDDEFDDGAPPPTAVPFLSTGYLPTYFPGTNTSTFGPEVIIDDGNPTTNDGRLILDSSTANPSTSNPKVPKLHIAVLESIALDRTERTVNTFTIEGLFDLGGLVSDTSKKDKFGIRTNDIYISGNGNDQLRLSVFNGFDGNNYIEFDRFGGDLNGTTKKEMVALEAGHDQILLRLSKLDAGSDLMTASFSYVDGGVIGSEFSFGQQGLIFQGEEHTRASFYAAEVINPVPIPAAAWLFGSGLLGMIGYSRRKKAA